MRQVLTAGEKDQPVLEEGGQGLFTKRLLEALDGGADMMPRDGILTAMEVAAFVQGRVIAISNGQQTPFFGTMDGIGQFVFAAPGLGPGIGRPPAPVAAPRRPPGPPLAGLSPPPSVARPPSFPPAARPPSFPPAARPQSPPPVASVPRPKGDLYVSSTPPGARVFVDGRDTGRVTPVLLEGIDKADHRVEVR